MTKKLKKQITELIIFSGITLWIVFNYKLFFDFVNFVLKLAMPIVVGIAIAFIINVPMRQIENKIFKIEKRKHKKLIRLISLLLSIVIIFGILALILFLIIPEFIEAIGTLGKNLPKSLDWINSVIGKVSNISPVVDDYVKNINVGHLVSSVGINANNVINIMISFLSSTLFTPSKVIISSLSLASLTSILSPTLSLS